MLVCVWVCVCVCARVCACTAVFTPGMCDAAFNRARNCVLRATDNCCQAIDQMETICWNVATALGYPESDWAAVNSYFATCNDNDNDNDYVNCNYNARIPELFAGTLNAECVCCCLGVFS